MGNTTDKLLLELDEQEFELAQELSSLQNDIDAKSFNGDFLDTVKGVCVDGLLKALDLSPEIMESGEDGVGGINLPGKFKDGIVHGKAAQTRHKQYQTRLENYAGGDHVLIDNEGENAFNNNKNNPSDNIDCYTGKELNGDTPKAAENKEDHWDNEHVFSKKELNDDAVLATYAMETDIAEFANSPDNLRKTLATINRSKGDTPLMEWVNKPSKEDPSKTNAEYYNLDMDKVRETYARASKARTKLIVTSAIKTEGKRLAINTAAYVTRVTIFKSIKLIAEETIREFKVKCVDPIKERLLRIVKAVKGRLKELWATFKGAFTNNIVSTVIDAFLNFFIKTTKNIFKIIRLILRDIFKAIKTMFAKDMPMKERLKAALKILSVALVGVVGVFLDEAISKAMSAVPFLAPIAGYISPVISAFIMGITSSLVLQAFNKYQKRMKYSKLLEEQIDIQNKLVAVKEMQVEVSSMQVAEELVLTIDLYKDTETLVASLHTEIQSVFNQINARLTHSRRVSMATDGILEENEQLLKQLEEAYNIY